MLKRFLNNEHQISFPDDNFNRFWQPFKDENPFVSSQSNITPTTFWNIPPMKAFGSALTTSRGKNLTLNWPMFSLPSGLYYIALYFQDNRHPSPYSWRVFDIHVNGDKFYQSINVTESGQSVVGTEWPLTGQTEFSMIPSYNSPVGPLINAGEIFQIVPFGRKTVTRDGILFSYKLCYLTSSVEKSFFVHVLVLVVCDRIFLHHFYTFSYI